MYLHYFYATTIQPILATIILIQQYTLRLMEKPVCAQVWGVAMCKVLVCLALLAGLHTSAHAQLVSTKGKEFWFGFMEGFLSTGQFPALTVYVSADRATTGQISVPGQNFTQNFSVTANNTFTFSFPISLVHNLGSDRITPQGIRVTANDSITVFALNYRTQSSDAAVILPLDNLGNDYFAVTVPGTGLTNTQFRRAEVLIVGTEDNSVIEITPTADVTNTSATVGTNFTTVSRPAGVPYTITLNRGQTYQLQSQLGDLTGTRVRAATSNPCIRFAVFSGNNWQSVCPSFGGGLGIFGDFQLPGTNRTCGTGNQLYEQLLPQKVWGQTYLAVPYATRSAGDAIRIVTATNGTQIFENGIFRGTINIGGFYQNIITQATVITTSQPTQVAQLSQTGATDQAEADPFMIILSPIEQNLNRITFTAFPSTITGIRYFVNIVTKTANTSRLRFDGQNIAITFQPVGGNSPYSFARNIITQGNHTINSDSGFVAYVYAYGNAEAYGYSVGVKLENLTLRASASVSGNVCTGLPINFNGQTTIPTSSWQWRFSDGAVLNGQNVTRTFNNPGTYTAKLVVQRSAGCALDSTQTSITISSSKQILTADTTVCQQASFQLRTAGGASTYAWSPATGLSSTTAAQPTVNTNTSRKYFLTTTNSAGCVFRDSVNVVVNPPIIISNPSADTVVCSGTTLTLRSNVTGTWRRLSGSTQVLAQNVNQVTVSFTTTAGIDRIDTLQIDAGCQGRRIIRTVFRPQITNPTAKVFNACTGTSIGLTGNVIGTWIRRNGTGAPLTLSASASSINYIFSLQQVIDTIIFRACGLADTVRFPLTFQPTITRPQARDTIVCTNQTFSFRFVTLPGGLTVRRRDSAGLRTVGNNLTANIDTFVVKLGNNFFSTFYPNPNPFFCKDSVRVVGVTLPPVINSPATDQSVCSGQRLSFTSSEVGYWFRKRGASVTPIGSVVDTVNKLLFNIVGQDTIIVQNCAGSFQRVVTVKPVPRITAPTARTTQACLGQRISFTADLSGDWSVLNSLNAATAIATGTSAASNVLFNSLGTFRVIVNINGCTDTVRIIVNPLPQPTLPTGGTRNLNCFNSNDGQISGTISVGRPPFVASLTGPNNFSQQQRNLANGAAFNFTRLAAASYTLTMQDSLGCTTSQTINITQPTQLVLDSVRIQDANCPTNLDGSARIFASGGSPPYSYNGNAASLIQNLGVGTYQLQVRDANGCTVNTQFRISSPPALGITLSTTAENCNLRNGTASALVSGGTQPYRFSWNTTPPQTLSRAVGLRSGINIVNITDAKGCTLQGQAIVDNIAGPRVSFTTVPPTPVTLIYPDATVQFSAIASAPGVTFQWDFADGSGGTGDNTSHTFARPGVYRVRLIGTDAGGCRDTAFSADSVRIVDLPQFVAPTAFSPNGDAQNERLEFQCNYLSEFQVTIFDRNGRVVFVSTNINNSWDGQTTAGPAPTGVYFYTANLRYINGLKLTRTGNVTLFR